MHAQFLDLLSPNDTSNNLANGKQWNWGENPGPNSTKRDKLIFIMESKTLAQQKLADLYEAKELLWNTHHKDYPNKIKRQESHGMISKTTIRPTDWNSLWVILIGLVHLDLSSDLSDFLKKRSSFTASSHAHNKNHIILAIVDS